MKKRNAAAGLLSLSMLFGGSAVSVFAAEPAPVLSSQAQNMTRGEFLLMLDKMVSLPDTAVHSQYKDVPAGSALSKVIDKMRANGVVAGNSAQINPNQPITQIEALAFVGRALGIPNKALPGSTVDLPKSHWAYGTATWLSAAGANIDWKQSDRILTTAEGDALLAQLLKTSPEAKQKLEQSQKAQAAVKSFKMNGTMTMQVKFDERALASMPSDARKQMDTLDEPLKMKIAAAFSLPDHIKMETEMKLPAMPGLAPEMKMEQYIIGHDMYMKVNMPGMPENKENPSGWMKASNAFPMDMKAMMEQQMQGIPPELEKNTFYSITKDGQLSYKTRINSLKDLMSMVQGMQGMGDMKAMFDEADKMVQSIYLQGTMKLDEKTQMPVVNNNQIVINFKPQQDMPLTQMIMTQDLTYSDYNADVKIELPAEAKNAQVVPMMGEKTATESGTKSTTK
ncbi:S-layer homology domain-containing protein [Aneurinibacillus uraniidurans]|uniref:S-layer homology domain-containing protein n=1 Tax=Aneurinibacillus uraniidurans TaxID=2966586 RepID=UPI00234ADC23|nr:S-layer homology domain-containing protein [Aneurinibacillus sp. B1]WCN38697.1 S-layer homology domain-containing protein [Aneurinibacillus sp. B1]